MPVFGQAGSGTLHVEVRNGSGALADADEVTLTVKDPSAVVVTGFPVTEPAVAHDAVGQYSFVWDVAVDAVLGDYTAIWNAVLNGVPLPAGQEQVEIVAAGSLSFETGAILDLEVLLAYLGVPTGDPRVAGVSRLGDAVSAEIRRLTRRDFEGVEVGYDETYRLDGAREFTLKHVPVSEITSIAKVAFDGTEDPAYEVAAYRLEDAARGVVRLQDDPDYVRVVWRTTGDIPAGIAQAYLDWCKARWEEKDHLGLASQTIGQWSESYATAGAIAGIPPHNVAIALMGAYHATGGGRV